MTSPSNNVRLLVAGLRLLDVDSRTDVARLRATVESVFGSNVVPPSIVVVGALREAFDWPLAAARQAEMWSLLGGSATDAEFESELRRELAKDPGTPSR